MKGPQIDPLSRPRKNTLKKLRVIRVKTRSQKKLRKISKKHFFTSFSCHPKWGKKWIDRFQIPILWKSLKKRRSIACIVEINCIVTIIILRNMFKYIKTSCFYLRQNRGEEIVLLSLHICRHSTSASLRYKILIICKSPPSNTHFVEQRRNPALSIQ